MVSNYPPDPNNNAASLNNPSGPQSGLGGSAPDYPPASSTPVSGGGANGSSRRLAQGTELSGGRYRIEKPVAAGGIGAAFRPNDNRFYRPCAVQTSLHEFPSPPAA